MKNINISPISAPKITKSAGMIPNARMKTPAVIIGKTTSPPPRIARLTLNFFFLILAGTFLPLYFSLSFWICFFTLSDVDWIKKPPRILSSSIWNFAIFCMMPDFQTAHMS